MRYGISAAALIVQNDRLLLVHHQAEGYDFWVPLGGGLQGRESIFDCARRETLEETGHVVRLGRILCIQEFWEPGCHSCRFFLLGRRLSGELTVANRGREERFLVAARFLSQDELQDLPVYPEVLRGVLGGSRGGVRRKVSGAGATALLTAGRLPSTRRVQSKEVGR